MICFSRVYVFSATVKSEQKSIDKDYVDLDTMKAAITECVSNKLCETAKPFQITVEKFLNG